MRFALLKVGLPLLLLLVAWLAGGRWLTLGLDRLFTVRMKSLPTTPIHFERGTIRIGGRPMSTMGPHYERLGLDVSTDADHRAILSLGAHRLTLGRVDSTRPDVTVLPDEGDQVEFTLDRSVLSWPTPFELNLMTGHSPGWKRNLYYRLVWTKRSGGRLEAVWRYEQWNYPDNGWGDEGGMVREGTTGLLRLTIRPGA